MGDKGSSMHTGVILKAAFPLITPVLLLDEQSLNQAAFCQQCMADGKGVFVLTGSTGSFSPAREHFRGNYYT